MTRWRASRQIFWTDTRGGSWFHRSFRKTCIGAEISLAQVAEKAFDVVFGLKEGLEQLQNEYDFVIIDCLPSFSHMHLADLIPVKPSSYGLHGIRDLLDTIRNAKDRL